MTVPAEPVCRAGRCFVSEQRLMQREAGMGFASYAVITTDEGWGDFAHRISLTIPPLGCVILKPEAGARSG